MMKTVDTIKKVLAAAVIMFLVLLMPVSSEAADSLMLSVTEGKGEAGEEVTVEVVAENIASTEGGQFVLTFDPELAKPIEIEAEALITDPANSINMANLEYDDGQLMFMWVTAAADTADFGSLCSITFKLLKEGESLLELEEVVISPDGFEVSVQSGTLLVGVAESEQEDPGLVVEVDSEPAEEESDSNTLVIVLLIVVVLAVAGFVVYKRLKKPGA